MNAPFGMATRFEYRHRFLIFALIYLATYALYNVDRMNIVAEMAHLNRAHRIPLDRQVFSFAALAAGMGVALWTWARAYSPIESGAGSAHSPQVLVADGPYRYVRNPIYLGSLLLVIGFGFFQPRLGFPLLIALSVIFLYRLIAFEEVKQREQYGDAFLAYCRHVPRLLPTLRPLAPADTREPRWRQAITRDAYLWGYVITLIAFVVTLNDKVGHRFTAAPSASGCCKSCIALCFRKADLSATSLAVGRPFPVQRGRMNGVAATVCPFARVAAANPSSQCQLT